MPRVTTIVSNVIIFRPVSPESPGTTDDKFVVGLTRSVSDRQAEYYHQLVVVLPLTRVFNPWLELPAVCDITDARRKSCRNQIYQYRRA